MIERGDKAKLMHSGAGSLEERLFAEGSVIQMIYRYSRETPAKQRVLLLMTGDLQYKPAEIEGLAKRLAADAKEPICL